MIKSTIGAICVYVCVRIYGNRGRVAGVRVIASCFYGCSSHLYVAGSNTKIRHLTMVFYIPSPVWAYKLENKFLLS